MVKAIMDRVFVKLDKPENVGGIILPEDVQNPRNIGRVVSVGPEVQSVKVGDRVVFHHFDEVPVEVPTVDDIVAVREFSLLGVIEDE